MTNDDNSPVGGGEPVLPPSKFGVGYTSGEPASGDIASPGLAPGYPPAAPAGPPPYVPNQGYAVTPPAASANGLDYPAHTPAPEAPPPVDYPPSGIYSPAGGIGIEPDNYLVWAILSTVFCCLPFGIVSIVKSTQVSSLWAQGQYAASQQASAEAKKWATWSAIAGAVSIVVSVLVWFVFPLLLMSAAISGY